MTYRAPIALSRNAERAIYGSNATPDPASRVALIAVIVILAAGIVLAGMFGAG